MSELPRQQEQHCCASAGSKVCCKLVPQPGIVELRHAALPFGKVTLNSLEVKRVRCFVFLGTLILILLLLIIIINIIVIIIIIFPTVIIIIIITIIIIVASIMWRQKPADSQVV